MKVKFDVQDNTFDYLVYIIMMMVYRCNTSLLMT